MLRNVASISLLVNLVEIDLSGTHLSDLTWALNLNNLSRVAVKDNILTTLGKVYS